MFLSLWIKACTLGMHLLPKHIHFDYIRHLQKLNTCLLKRIQENLPPVFIEKCPGWGDLCLWFWYACWLSFSEVLWVASMCYSPRWGMHHSITLGILERLHSLRHVLLSSGYYKCKKEWSFSQTAGNGLGPLLWATTTCLEKTLPAFMGLLC